MREVAGRFALDTERFVFTRCLRCNAKLRVAEKAEVGGAAPTDVLARNEKFWRCPACGRIYWHGTHVENSLRRLRGWLA
jgi:uncharacterized protein